MVIVAANISIPPMIPVIIYLSYKMGAYWMGSDAFDLPFDRNITLQTMYSNLQQYLYGSITLAILAALLVGLISYFILKIFKRNTSVVSLSCAVMEKILLPIFNYFEKRRFVFYTSLLGCFLVFGFFASKIRLEEDISKILPDDKKIQKLNEVFQDSKFLDKLVIVVSKEDTTGDPEPDSLVAFADDLVVRLNKNLKPYISNIQDKVDDALALEMFESIHQNLPVYLE